MLGNITGTLKKHRMIIAFFFLLLSLGSAVLSLNPFWELLISNRWILSSYLGTALFIGSLSVLPLVCFFLYTNRNDFRNEFNKKDIAFMGCIFIFSVALRLFLIGTGALRWIMISYMYEDINLPIISPYYDFRGIGFTVLLKIPSMILGPQFSNIFVFNAMLGSLIPIVVFLLTYFIFKSKTAAAFSSAIAVVNPLLIAISPTESFTVPSILFSLLSILFLVIYHNKSKRLPYMGISLLMLFLAIQMRQEYIAFLLVYFIAFVALFRGDSYDRNLKRLLIIFFILLIPSFLTSMVHYGGMREDIFLHGTSFGKDSTIISYIGNYATLASKNIIPNLQIMFSDAITVVFAILAIVGILTLKDKRRYAAILGVHIIVFFFLYSMIHQSSFKLIGQYKYLTSLLPPLFILASGGLCGISKKLRRCWLLPVLSIILLIPIVATSLSSLNPVWMTTEMNQAPDGSMDYHSLYRAMEYESVKRIENVDKSCGVFINGKAGLFPYIHGFHYEDIFIIYNMTHLAETSKKDFYGYDCIYFYSGYSDPEEDRIENIQRIGLVELVPFLESDGFNRVFSEDIGNSTILLYKKLES
ncbi:MAG: hypothetical protein DRO99_01345 [Candidatus Aenigmatarchaeota archaeon]|nr:MAG: hypothetical protein DRO99_01345 [Candidatus Aenigmarchaeota archaeon]